MDRDSNLLFGLMATQLMRLPPKQWVEAAVSWAAHPERDLPEYLVESGTLSEGDCRLLRRLVDEVVQAHDGDASAALSAFGGQEQVSRAFRGSIVLTASGGVEPATDSALPWVKTEGVPSVEESAGRYEFVSEFDRGGMGKVLLVHDRHLGRDIALKELLPIVDASGSTSRPLSAPHMARFLQEARITGQLEHPSIVPVYELGHRNDGTLYYTMKLVRGKTLSQAIKEAGTLNERLKLLPHFADLCQAMAYAHNRGVIHRDIKPGNVMVGEFGETVVLDWGLAKAKSEKDVHADGLAKTLRFMNEGDEEGVAKSAYGEALGTPAYMPPEQAEGRLDEVDERADVYSLGAVLYELLTGHAPFEGGTMYSTLWCVMTEEPRPIRSWEPDAPPELVAICHRAMKRDRGHRYDSAKAIADEIDRFESGALVHTYEYRFGELFGRFVRKHKAIIATVAIATCIVILGGVASYLRVVHQKRLAVEAYEKETQARMDEMRARQLAERESYNAGVLLAQKHAEDGFYDLAKRALWEAPPLLRDWEWGYVLASCNQDLFTFEGHQDRIVDLAVSPDSTRFVTASWDRTARVWDIRSGTLAATLEGHEDGITSVAFSPDGARVLTASFDGTARTWDAQNGAQLARALVVLRGHEGAVNSAAYSHDGARVITASQDKTAKVWDAQTGAQLATLEGHENNVGSASFSPSDKQILTVSWRDRVRVWDASTYKQTGAFAVPAMKCYDAVYSPDESRILVTFMDETARVWHAKTGIGLYSLRGHSDRILRAVFSPDGSRIATASADKTARVWDARNGALAAVLEGHNDPVEDVAFSPDGTRLLTGSRDKTAKIWDAATGGLIATLGGHGDSVVRAAFTPDGARVVTASYDGTAKLWKAHGGIDEALRLARPSVSVSSAEFNGDGSRLLMVLTDGVVAVWNVATFTELASFVSFSDFSRAAISPDGKRVVTVFSEPGFTSNVWVWDVESREILATFSGHLTTVNDAAFSPDGSRVVTASDDGTARVWAADTGMEQVALVGLSKTVYKAAFSPDGQRVVTASSDDAARLWDIQTGADMATFPNDKWLDNVALNPEGSRLLTTTEGSSIIWDVTNGKKLIELEGRPDNINKRPFSPSGARIVGISSGKAKIYNAETGKELFALPDVECALFHPDGIRLLTVAKDNTVRFLMAAPYREDMLPGNAGMKWQTRFDLYKQQHLADAAPLPMATLTPFDLVVATRDDVVKRLRQLVQVFSPEFEAQWAQATQLSEEKESAPVSIEGPASAVLSRLCLRKEDQIARVNDTDTPSKQACLNAFNAFLKESEAGSAPGLTLDVSRGGTVRRMQFKFVERAQTSSDTTFPRVTFARLLWVALPFVEKQAELLDEHDRRQAKWHREPAFLARGSLARALEESVGFWIDESYNPFFDSLLREIGMRPGDRVTSINGTTIQSSRDLLSVARNLQKQLRDGTLETCVVELDRGQFRRLNLAIRLQ
jgi:WD40 repeat protein/serine/threonine protein kinase